MRELVGTRGPFAAAATKTVAAAAGRKPGAISENTVFKGEVTGAPMIEECRLCMECRLIQTVDLPADELFIGEIVGAFADAGCLTDGKPDVKKIDPFTLTMPDNGYWRVGERVGKAWRIGESLKV